MSDLGGNGGAGRAPGNPGLMAVQSNVVQDVLVGRLYDDVVERDHLANLPDIAGEAIDRAPEVILGQERAGRLSPAVATLSRRLARLGYLSRLVERERFDRARAPMPDLAERLGEHAGEAEEDGEGSAEAAVAVAGELARREPAELPQPDDERAASWRVPGPGGHVRHYLAVQAARLLAPDLPEDAGKRAWLYGFFVRSLEERAEEDPGGAG